MSTDLAIPTGQEAEQRLPLGLLVKTGELVPVQNRPDVMRPKALDHFRFAAGTLEQYADAAAKAQEVYGPEPRAIDDVMFLSNVIGDVLEIRVKAWSKSGLRIWGKTNFATLDRDEFLERVDAWEDACLYFPRQVSDVPKRLRDSWQGEPIEFTLNGPEDPRIKQFEMRVETSLRFGLPRVLGLGAVALYSTTSRRNTRNLYEGVWFASRAFEGRLIGIPFRLRVEPRRTSYFDSKERAYKSSSTFQVTLTTPFTLQEAIDAIREQREALGPAPVTGPAVAERLALPEGQDFFASDERDQTEATEVPIVPVEAFDPSLRDDEEPVEGEIVEENPFEGLEMDPADPGVSEPEPAEPTNFEDLMPDTVKRTRRRSS